MGRRETRVCGPLEAGSWRRGNGLAEEGIRMTSRVWVHTPCELRLMGTANTQCGHLLQVYPADVGQPGLAGTTWLYQVLRVHHHRPHAAHQLGFFMLHRQGDQGAHSFGQVSLPGPGTKRAMPQSDEKRNGSPPSTQLNSHISPPALNPGSTAPV